QSYTGNVTLGSNSTLTGASITVSGTLDGAHALAVQSAGATSFGASVGGTVPLASFSSQGGGSVGLLAPSVTTSGAQSYGGALQLSGSTTLTGSALTFSSAVSGAQDLQLQTNALSSTGGI